MDQRGCAIILDDVVGKLFEDLNDCYRDFERQRIDALGWPNDGSTPQLDAALPHQRYHLQTARSIRRARHSVVMENANSTVLNLLDFKDYTLVDTGNSSADLFSLANNDVILLGESSFGALAHLVAPPKGLTIVEGADEPNKHRDSTRRSLVLASGRIADFVQMIIENFPGGPDENGVKRALTSALY
ncbi:BQ5605_C075g12923 [Microbotryum silenes-dioicae]|uniref:BQ5605_C075g12923 protein n=1 Tax=Microbotryum silenes-dioicae TaxID=796604 RepID=A0A2X0NIX8_9BASI|nr:BQ5605_C075g12923 [Microbotryum silenes-dioicae]